MKYQLSKLIPLFFTSEYESLNPRRSHRSTWWQWRGRVFAHREVIV